MTVRVGTSGWAYPEWRGAYYPPEVTHRRELDYVAGRLGTVELNGSFYSLQRPASYRAWRDRTPESFVFAVKGHRYVTHLRRLRDPHVTVANFLASGVLELGEKLGPVLWQFPERLSFDPGLVAEFLSALPRNGDAAAALVADHATMLPPDPGPRPPVPRLRHALEVRHPTFGSARFVELLRAHRVALVAADTAGKFPYFDDVTADFTYARLHGATELYASTYDTETLTRWATKIEKWRTVGDVYVYFDNTAKAAAPHDAERLAALVNGVLTGPRPSPGRVCGVRTSGISRTLRHGRSR
ncbi:MAG TPA: DUF72 domain-containing protein [Pseudonocardiaceae bacterium]|nr:DUF72 domain-containing protein [Pseudonocardiaceae bacterium]